MSTASTAHPVDTEDEAFTVSSRLEIRSLLRSIEQKNVLLRMQIKGRSVAIVTTILELDPDTDSFIIDNSADEDFNRRIVAAEDVAFETVLDKVRIHFSSNQVSACTHDQRPALRLPIPASLTRIQRREYYRVECPVTNPARCTFQFEEDGKSKQVVLAVKDVSAGGIGVLDNRHVLDNARGATYKNCRLELPEVGIVPVDLRVVQSLDDTMPNGKERRVLGCKFVALVNPVPIKVQSYIGLLERKANAKRRGFE